VSPLEGPDEVRTGLERHGYLADEGIATAAFLAISLPRPLLLEGEAGTGKTSLAKALAALTGGELIRLQCWEGIDASQAVYDWDHARQLLHLRAAEASGEAGSAGTDALERSMFDARFLLKRPLLRALEPAAVPPVLLIDEVDRADDEFEAYLLEVLSDFQVTVPELGTIRAATPPVVVLTSNRTRDLHDALKRRCLYHWVEHPSFEREVSILRLAVPAVPPMLARQLAAAAGVLRGLGLAKPPGVAETIDWAEALGALALADLDERAASSALGAVLKHREDQELVREHGLDALVRAAALRAAAP
jgi:MoxR-like ATPase